MRRINSSTAAANANGPGRAGFVEGNLQQQIPTTHFTPEWSNHVQEEIARAIEAIGVSLNPANYEQLTEAIHGLRVITYSGPVNSELAFNPPGWNQADVAFIDVTSGNGEILGFNPYPLVRTKRIFSSGQLPLRLAHNSPSALPGYRLITQNTLPIVLGIGRSADIQLSTPNGFMGGAYGQAWYVSNYTLPTYNTSIRLAGGAAEILYASSDGSSLAPRARIKHLPLYAPGAINSGSDAFWHTAGSPGADQLFCYGPTAAYKAPFALPSGSLLTGVRALLEKSTGTGSIELRAFKCVTDKSAPYTASTNIALGATGSISASGRDVATVGAISETIDNATTTYHARILSSSGATGGLADMIHWVEVEYLDPGPRNW